MANSLRLPKRFAICLLIALCLPLFFPATGNAAQVTLAWDASTDAGVAGYRLYHGTQSKQYTLLGDVGAQTAVVASDLVPGTTYHFAVTAYDGQGVESPYSDEVAYTALAACTYTISPTNNAFTSAAGTGSITVTTQTGCGWTANGTPWMTITSGASGTGSGTVNYAVSTNTGTSSRTAAATVAGQIFTMTQAGPQDHTISTPENQITAAFIPSDYFDAVQRMYIGYYHRAADAAGLIYWAGRLDASGGNLTDMTEAFANSAESQALHGTINSSNISTVVSGIYKALFDRDAETGGLNYYVNGFSTGTFTAATIMLNILNGAQNEDLVSVNNKVTAANLFTGAN